MEILNFTDHGYYGNNNNNTIFSTQMDLWYWYIQIQI